MTEPARRSDRTRSAILAAARERFAADGYDRATIRAIAAEASIDPSMVMRYYGNKERLFAAAAEVDLRLPDLTEIPHRQLGATLVGHFVERFEQDEALRLLLRAASTNQAAVDRIQAILASQLVPVIQLLGPENDTAGPGAATRSALIATQVLGFALCRYVLCLPPVVTMSRPSVLNWLGPTVQRYLTATASPVASTDGPP